MNRAREDSIFRSLLKAAPDGILMCDRKGVITLANDQCVELLGYSSDELVGQTIELLVPDYIRPRHDKLREGYFDEPHKRPMGMGLELSAKRKDGQTIPVEISLSPVDVDGAVCAIAIIRDVTDLRRLHRAMARSNEELKRSNDELEKFAYVASHDLQEPLRMVGGYTQLLKRRYADKLDSDAVEFIDFAVDGVKRMQSLINDLLTYSRISTRGRPFETVDTADVFRQVLANLQVAIEETKARVTSSKLPKVTGDAVQLAQLFQNVVGNALKFAVVGQPAEVKVTAVRDGEFWKFTVSDNGIGIEPGYEEKVFIIFQRLHTRDKYSGTGIGLAICKKVVERHGGQIWFDSAPGQGTQFHFTIPVERVAP